MKVPNPLQEIYETCNRPMKEKAGNLPPFPRMIDIELTNACNFRCVMCPTGQRTVRRKTGFMDYELFMEILCQVYTYNTPLRFIRWGEPMLYPKLQDAIVDTKTFGLICHINTNGSLIDNDWNRFFVESCLDSIKFSFQGTSKVGYEFMRNSPDYAGLLDRIRDLYELRESYSASAPFIQIGTTVTNETESDIRAFIDSVDKFTDAVYVGKTRDLQTPSKPDQFCECPEVFDKLSVNWDGSVSACCGDYDNYTIVGNLKEQSLKDIWTGKPMQEMRKMLLEYRHNENYLCARCARSLL